MPLRQTLSSYWQSLQGELFPALQEELGPLSERHRDLVMVLDLARVEAFIPSYSGLVGRPPSDRPALARAFIAKAVLNIAQTEMLIERLMLDKPLRRLCGWSRAGAVPSASSFSRAFARVFCLTPSRARHDSPGR